MSAPFPAEHPSLSQPVTEVDRQRAEAQLADAYADGRLDEAEFERRITAAVTATTRRELNEAFLGLVEPPRSAASAGSADRPQWEPYRPGGSATGVRDADPYGAGPYGADPYGTGPYGTDPYGAGRPGPYGAAPAGYGLERHRPGAVDPSQVDGAERATGAIAHFLPIVSWLFGPGLMFLLSKPGSFARRESAKAFNFQLIMTTTFIVGGILSMVLPDVIVGMIFSALFLAWLLGTVIGGAKAASGEDWTNPLRKVVPLQVLPEGRPDPRTR